MTREQAIPIVRELAEMFEAAIPELQPTMAICRATIANAKAMRLALRLLLAEGVPAALENTDTVRLDALAHFLDEKGTATFTLWANEMVELAEIPPDEDEEGDAVPMLCDNIRDLLDELATQQSAAAVHEEASRDEPK